MRERGTKGGCKSHGGMLPVTVPRNYVELCSRGVKHAHISTTVRTTFIPSAPLYYRLKRKNKNKIKLQPLPRQGGAPPTPMPRLFLGYFLCVFFVVCCLCCQYVLSFAREPNYVRALTYLNSAPLSHPMCAQRPRVRAPCKQTSHKRERERKT